MTTRIRSVDFLRGIVMVLMAIDHARYFLHNGQVGPEDLAKTTPALFFTRWITHFCAPVFIFLTGTATYLFEQKVRSKKQVSSFLVTRGLLLILLELTLFRFCWQPGAPFFQPYIMLLVIWGIAISMLFLALLIWLPYRAILVFGAIVLLLHNTLAGVHFPEGSARAALWTFFYQGGMTNLFGKVDVLILYPMLTYFGLIALGYCLGYIFTPAFTMQRRRKILIGIGSSAVIVFILLRYSNWYGDPRPWEPGKNTLFSFMAFIRTTKYPVSLLYALMTLGPALILLGLIEPVKNRVVSFFVTIGAVPMFYYILHLLLFVLIGIVAGFHRHSLAAVYGWFAIVVVILYLLCRWYAPYKFNHPEKKWLKYL